LADAKESFFASAFAYFASACVRLASAMRRTENRATTGIMVVGGQKRTKRTIISLSFSSFFTTYPLLFLRKTKIVIFASASSAFPKKPCGTRILWRTKAVFFASALRPLRPPLRPPPMAKEEGGKEKYRHGAASTAILHGGLGHCYAASLRATVDYFSHGGK